MVMFGKNKQTKHHTEILHKYDWNVYHITANQISPK